MSNIDNFKKELHDLLVKYNASISCLVYGDTHGLSYKMIVDFGKADNWKEHELVEDSTLDWNDI